MQNPYLAQAHAQVIEIRKRIKQRQRDLAERHYSRARDLAIALGESLKVGLEEVDYDIGIDWTRWILLKLARRLKAAKRYGLPFGLIRQAMIGEAAILRKQIGSIENPRGYCGLAGQPS